MLRILTFDGRLYRLRLSRIPCPTTLHRMVRSAAGLATILHKQGTTVLRMADIRSASFEDESRGAPWDYDNPLN